MISGVNLSESNIAVVNSLKLHTVQSHTMHAKNNYRYFGDTNGSVNGSVPDAPTETFSKEKVKLHRRIKPLNWMSRFPLLVIIGKQV